MAGGFSVQLTGDWERLRYTINHLNTNFRIQALELQKDQAERLKSAIEDKVFTLTGKPYDISRPVNTGIWWLETLELMSSLEVRSVGGMGSTSFFIGFGEGNHSSDGGMSLSYSEIAQKNEENHPLIAKVWDELEPVFKKEWEELVMKAIRGGI